MYQTTAKGLAALGRNGDSMLMHVNPQEVSALSKILGPTTTNPQTGLPEASNWGMALNLLGGLATGVGGLGLGAAVAGPAEEAITGALGEGILSDVFSKAAPAIAGATLGAGIGGITGGKYGALGGGLQGALSGGLGGLEAENIVGAQGPTTQDTAVLDAMTKDRTLPASPVTPEVDPLAAKPAYSVTPQQEALTADQKIKLGQDTSGGSDFYGNLSKFGSKLGSWDSLKQMTSDYGGPLFMSGMVGQAVSGMGQADDAYNLMKRRQAEEKLRQDRLAQLAYQNLYGGQGIGVNYAGGGPVSFQASMGDLPVSMTIPGDIVDQIHDAGGIQNLVQQYAFANGGYINLQPEPQGGFYPMSQIASAKPYPAATPQRTEVLNANYNGYAGGGFIEGDGDGMSDDIDADIEGEEPVRVADGEFVIPKHIVDRIGVDKLDELLKQVRMASYGSEDQIEQDAGKEAAMSMLGLA